MVTPPCFFYIKTSTSFAKTHFMIYSILKNSQGWVRCSTFFVNLRFQIFIILWFRMFLLIITQIFILTSSCKNKSHCFEAVVQFYIIFLISKIWQYENLRLHVSSFIIFTIEWYYFRLNGSFSCHKIRTIFSLKKMGKGRKFESLSHCLPLLPSHPPPTLLHRRRSVCSLCSVLLLRPETHLIQRLRSRTQPLLARINTLDPAQFSYSSLVALCGQQPTWFSIQPPLCSSVPWLSVPAPVIHLLYEVPWVFIYVCAFSSFWGLCFSGKFTPSLHHMTPLKPLWKLTWTSLEM